MKTIKFLSSQGRILLYSESTQSIHSIQYKNDRETLGKKLFDSTPQFLESLIRSGSLSEYGQVTTR